MGSVSVQFHAMPDQAQCLMQRVLDDPSIYVVFQQKERVIPWPWPRVPSVSFIQSNWLGFTLAPPVLPAESRFAFLGLNPDALIWEVGELTAKGLGESWLSAKTDDAVALKRWKAVAARLKKSTRVGAVAVNPHTGATGPMKGHRFTEMAQRAYCAGLALRPVAGNAVIELPKLAGQLTH